MLRLICLLLLLPVSLWLAAQSKPDTLYYTRNWMLCEKPLATYYRIASVEADSFLFFKGPVKDYYSNGKLQMQGAYNDSGLKEGVFVFYHPNGNKAAQGRYRNNEMHGNWQYYHPNGKEKATIYTVGKHFTFVKFVDSTGTTTLMEGSGHFLWPFNQTKFDDYQYHVKGMFLEGQRHHNWKFYKSSILSDRNQVVMEQYKMGKFKRGFWYPFFRPLNLSRETELSIEPFKFDMVDRFFADSYFSAFSNRQALLQFIRYKQAPLFENTDPTIEGAIQFVVNKLVMLRPSFVEKGKEYGGAIQFGIKDGQLTNIELTGNLSESERQKLVFFLEKFRGIPEANSREHKVYVFQIAARDVMPNTIVNWNEVMISILPKDQFIKATKAQLKAEQNKVSYY